MAAFCALGAGGLATAAALAAGPVKGRSFGGSGGDYMNNAPTWKREATGKFSFRTSRDGTRIIDFRGTYSYYCGSGTATLTAGYVSVRASGAFGYHFTQRVKTGTDYGEIYGKFARDGRSASINYLDDFVAKGKTVRHPYDTTHPSALGCTSWVRGTARVQ